MARLGRLLYLAFGLLLFSSFFMYSAFSQSGNLTAAINRTTAYVNEVNQSAYLIFYPHLTSAYNYISNATNISRTDPAYAYALLAEAMSSAQQELNRINSYRTDSFYALAVISTILAIALYVMMQPRTVVKNSK